MYALLVVGLNSMLVVALAGALVVLALHSYFMLRNSVPYVLLPVGALPIVARELDVRPQDTVYDLGCGDGRVLRALQSVCSEARYVGVENDPVVWALAKLRTRNVQIRRGEIATTSLHAATRVYAYLGPQLMAELELRFERELPAGARVVSVQFPLPTRQADNIIELDNSLSYASRLYVYTY